MIDHESCGSALLRALAVFHDQGAGFWPRFFGRPGFRHCFVALNDGRAWIVVDPCSDGTRISAEVAATVDLAAHYRRLGCTVVETAVAQGRRRYGLPWAFTCVEAVKRILHVHDWWLWTPYQLYRCLEKEYGKHLQSSETESATAAATTSAEAGGGTRNRRGAQEGTRRGETAQRAPGDDPDRRPGRHQRSQGAATDPARLILPHSIKTGPLHAPRNR